MEINNTYVIRCDLCNLFYKTHNGLWKHNLKFHKPPVDISNPDNNTKKYECIKCKKQYEHKNSKYRHQKKCIEKAQDIEKIKSDLDKIKKQLNKKSNKKIINNINNGVINNTINKFGSENVLELNEQEINTIFDKEIECIITFVELLNFNERLPSNHTFCTTSLESKFLSTYNTDTNTIEKDRKKYFFDKLLSSSVQKMEMLYNSMKGKFKIKKRTQIQENINTLKALSSYDFNNKIVRELMNSFNLLSYNKKNMIIKTWNPEDPDFDNMGTFLDDLDRIEPRFEQQKTKHVLSILNMQSDSNTDTDIE